MTRLAIALDTQRREDFLEVFHRLEDMPVIFKVGLKMLPLLNREDWNVFKNRELFIDAKLHDIPSQVADAVKAYGDLGAKYLTLHLAGGRKMLEEAVKVAQPYDLRLLGVSVLTSIATEDLRELGYFDSNEAVANLLRLGTATGLDSFVMSVAEVAASKKKYPYIYCVTPGISLTTPQADQQRSATVEEAVNVGSNMIVVGRSILSAANPVQAVEKILSVLK